MSEYMVLKQSTGADPDSTTITELWEPIGGSVEALNAQQAVRRATDGKSAQDRSGVFVAVPARSWAPMTRRVETVEKDAWT